MLAGADRGWRWRDTRCPIWFQGRVTSHVLTRTGPSNVPAPDSVTLLGRGSTSISISSKDFIGEWFSFLSLAQPTSCQINSPPHGFSSQQVTIEREACLVYVLKSMGLQGSVPINYLKMSLAFPSFSKVDFYICGGLLRMWVCLILCPPTTGLSSEEGPP